MEIPIASWLAFARDGSTEIFYEQEQMQRVGWRLQEVEPSVKCDCRVILGVHGDCTDACDIGCLRGAAHCIFERSGAVAPPLPGTTHCKPCQEHDWNGMVSQALPKPLRRIVEGNLAHDECVKADHPVIPQSQVGLGRAGFLVREGKADKIAVERLDAAIESVERMMGRNLFDAEGGHLEPVSNGLGS